MQRKLLSLVPMLAPVLVLGLAVLLGATKATASPRVLVSVPPLHALVLELMQGVGEPQLLLSGAMDFHHFSFKPSHIKQLESADYLVWVGRNLEAPLARLLEKRSISAAQRRLDALPSNGNDFSDPHLWLSPKLMRIALLQVKTDLQALDPDNAQQYGDNYRVIEVRLTALSQAIQQGLSGHSDRSYAVLHNAYQAFIQEVNLAKPVVLESSSHGQLSLKRLRKALTQSTPGLDCVLVAESRLTPRLEGLIGDLGLPLQSVNFGLEASYFSMMQGLIDAFKACFDRGKAD